MKYAHYIRDDAMTRSRSIISDGLDAQHATAETASCDDRQCAVSNAICDLMHYADEYDLDFSKAVEDAQATFNSEIDEILADGDENATLTNSNS